MIGPSGFQGAGPKYEQLLGVPLNPVFSSTSLPSNKASEGLLLVYRGVSRDIDERRSGQGYYNERW
jgi:hypothetical protein